MPDSQQNSVTAQLEYQKLMVSLLPLLRSLLLSLLPSSSLRALALSRNRCATALTSQTSLRRHFHRHRSAGIRCPHWLPPEAVQGKNGSKRQGTEDDDIEAPTKKRRVLNKKIKDPDAPKRAASSYIFFQNDLRQELRKQHPHISAAEIMARVSKQWAEMTREQKAVSPSLKLCP
jgi:hypothetical protein